MIRSTSRHAGQAMAEFALILPILLILILGTFQVGIALLMQTQLTHAAQQGASAGANEQAVPRRCTVAQDTARTVYGRVPSGTQCSQPGNVVELTISDMAPIVSPFGPWTLDATARAVTP
jgi:Flp pilus assembly protein TadG